MYIGDTGVPGLHHLFKEIIDNSIDEVLAGHCNKVTVTLGKDRTVSVEDNGRGIPVDINTKSGKPGVELALTELHAGGKFGEGGYKTSGGLHGVGASCVNALSEWMETSVKRGGKIHRIRFARGKVTRKLHVVGDCDPAETGTTQRWLADSGARRSARGAPVRGAGGGGRGQTGGWAGGTADRSAAARPGQRPCRNGGDRGPGPAA